MILSTSHCELLLFHDWQFVHKFIDDEPSPSTHGGYVSSLPGFDLGAFPFVSWSLSNRISLVNLSTFNTDLLVKEKGAFEQNLGQQPYFFHLSQEAISIHFATKNV